MHATQQHLPLRRGGREAGEPGPPATLRTAGDRPSRSDRPARPHGTEVAIGGLHKAYGDRAVLQQIDLRIAPGEFVAIVGRSGCGKSTLLRLVAGLERPGAGRIALDGRPQDGHDDGTRIMFQDARLLPWKRVLDNIALGLPGREGRERAREALAQVGLAERANEWPAVLSGGQRQRVALARALVHRPRLLLLDEPLGALDALTRIEMQQLIERLWLAHGFTALLVTHDVAEAVALADRVVLIEDHRIAFDERVPLPRPRSHGAPAFAALEERVLRRVLRQPATESPDNDARTRALATL
ncbi:sulfonate ABC transporter ATP-binding protein [Cupriavidus gilardii CR3]|uniref:ATP-binding cassette domain-containing protein n=1 Tax=Cupriavidus gilardii TaxID=82541 RepID=A0A849B548_9BURK|nr:ATP-binding cassette domain-containing protein [Cupriavidus gilardii]ALD93149.1 sulfonate ABC transporter ATP-binding protein [Cupriavidus gilardii CR3]KAB0599440.1 ATP-binding cassette domain-containing protein [Cupriavidus gilardii]MCT9013061.1 ATP-binding cassette domain-containing protein [Cupriavidus gilardii]MCT9052615.1 ATP-binding cassette domain-containing protein [Cupriavidus gilardii]NNH10690.1 ATP-binding cassette domain-containing protein [Cupriavidus gilardii]